MRRRTLTVAIGTAILIASCSSGDGNEGDAAAQSADERATATSAAELTGAPSTPTTRVTTAADLPTTGPGASTATVAPTTIPQPSPDADLPTQAPGKRIPVTTLAGPLPTPEVEMIEVASFDQPVDIATEPGDPQRFVVQRGGTIIASSDESDAEIFSIDDVDGASFTSDGSEQGLLGLVFHPTEDLAYVNFTDADGDTVVAEFATEPITYVFDTSSYREVITIPQPFANHNGGQLAFGPDRLLYIGTGDGGSADDPERSALDLSSRLGKILRIDPAPSGDTSFTVPPDNPFVDTPNADPTIWSYGLRNPWRFSFDSLTGDLWIGDVGQETFEEINVAGATDGRDAGRGLSFGWSALEGTNRFNEDQPAEGHVDPAVSYPHLDGLCAVSAGVVARNSFFEDLNGWYVYGDFCTGQIWGLDTTSIGITPDGPTGTPRLVELAVVPGLAAVVEGPFGDIHTISHNGPVQRLAPV